MADRDRARPAQTDDDNDATHPGHTPDMGVPDENQSILDNVREQSRKEEPDEHVPDGTGQP